MIIPHLSAGVVNIKIVDLVIFALYNPVYEDFFENATVGCGISKPN